MEEKIKELFEHNIEEFYSKLIDFQDISSSGEASCLCPVHGDTHASLHINIETGKWHCKTCAKGGHDPITFYQFLYDIDRNDAIEELSAKFGLSPIPTYDMDQGHQNLLKSSTIYQNLLKRGISSEILRKYKVGWDGYRINIPILDFGRNIRNIRKHLLACRNPEDKKRKTISAFTGTGVIRLFPVKNLRHKTIYLFEGELDTLLAITLGLNAVCVTGGAGSWRLNFNKYFVDKIVYICYDVDKAGLDGSKKIAYYLSEVAEEVYLINLPNDKLPENGDFTDYIKLVGFEEFKKLKPTKFEGLKDDEADKIIEEVHLSETVHPIFYNKRIKTTALITGKGELFMVPKKIKATCKQDQSDTCTICRLKSAGGKLISKLDREDIKYLKMFSVTDSEQISVLKQFVSISSKCKKFRIEILEAVNVEEVVLVPEINYDDVHHNFIPYRSAYIVGNLMLDSNRPYEFEGKVLPHPKTQKSTILIYKSKSVKDDIDNFTLTPDLMEKMKIFQAKTLTEMYKVQKEKFKDYEAVTKIFKRPHIFTAVDLSYYSALSYNFNGRLVKRGHINGLIFGDTRTGKSDIVDNLMFHFRAGEATGGENASFAGLVGGVQQSLGNGRWNITWKTIPLNNRRLVKVDEFHEVIDKDIHKMSEMISTGIASIQKIHTEKAAARTRLIFIANDKYGKNLSEFQFACQAIAPIMGGHNEDIARLDYALAVSAEEVNIEEIEKLKREKLEVKKFTSDLCHALVMWVWSKRANEIVIEESAEKLISELALAQAKKFHTSLPLVPPAEQSLKLSRLAVATAGMYFSTDKECRKLYVKERHVKFAAQFLEDIYTSEVMGFHKYSKVMAAKDKLKDPAQLKQLNITKDICDLLLSMQKFTVGHLETIFNTDRDITKLKMFTLLKNNAIKPYGTNMYIKTPAFIRWLSSEDFLEIPENDY